MLALITTPRARGFPIDLLGLVTAQVTENDVPGVVALLENPRNAGENLAGGLSRIASDASRTASISAKGYVSFKGNRHTFRSWVTGEWLLM